MDYVQLLGYALVVISAAWLVWHAVCTHNRRGTTDLEALGRASARPPSSSPVSQSGSVRGRADGPSRDGSAGVGGRALARGRSVRPSGPGDQTSRLGPECNPGGVCGCRER